MQKTWHSVETIAYWTWTKSGLTTSLSHGTFKELLAVSNCFLGYLISFLFFFPRLEHLDESLGLSLHSNGSLTTLFLCVLGHLAFTDWLGPHLLGSSTFNSFFQRWLFLVQSLFNISSNIVLFYSPTLPSNKISLHCFALCIFYDVFL